MGKKILMWVMSAFVMLSPFIFEFGLVSCGRGESNVTVNPDGTKSYVEYTTIVDIYWNGSTVERYVIVAPNKDVYISSYKGTNELYANGLSTMVLKTTAPMRKVSTTTRTITVGKNMAIDDTVRINHYIIPNETQPQTVVTP